MNDEQKQPLLEEWFSDREVAPENEQEGVAQVMSEVSQTRQQGRWLPLPVHRPRSTSTTPSTTDTTEYEPSPIPASNGHTPTVIGRTQSMLSPVKAITAGALVFALGGVMLIAQPFDQQGGGVPGAATDTEVVPATWVTGDIAWASNCSGPTREDDAGVRRERNYLCEPQRWTGSDPRFTGEVEARWSADVYEPDGDPPGPSITVATQAYRLRNEAGGWACASNLLSQISGYYVQHQAPETLMCVGDGANDGLSAILVVDWAPSQTTFVGLIFPGDAPPLPVPSAAE